MSNTELLLIGVGLAMDAVAVSMSNGMVFRGMPRSRILAMPFFFGIFQGIMPLIGFLTGSLFAAVMERYSGIVIFVILGCIGGKMIVEGVRHGRGSEDGKPEAAGMLTWRLLLAQAFATSVDAFAVGVGFAAQSVAILSAVTIIAVVTALLSGAAIVLGKKCGNLLGSKAEILGGMILVIIGIKALL